MQSELIESAVREAVSNAGDFSRFSQILDLIPACVYTCDAEGRITFYNEAAVKLWGRAPEVGRDQWSGAYRMYQADGSPLPHDRCPMAVTLKEGRSVRGVEIIIEREDGSRLNILTHPELIRDASGRVIGAINMLIDITERKRAKDALRQSEERLCLATKTGKVGVWDWDIVNNQITWTDSLYAAMGIRRKAFEGTVQAFTALIHPVDRDRVSQALQRALEDGAPCEMEFRLVRPNGGTVWFFANAIVMREDERPVRMLGAALDITERKHAELALRVSEHEAAKRFQVMADAAPVMVWQSDMTKACTWFNKGWVDFIGRPLEEETGRGWTENIHPDDLQRCVQTYENSFDARQPFEIDYRLRRHDGVYRWVLNRGVPHYQNNGRFGGYIGSCIDITERKKAADAVRQSEAHFRMLADNITQFAWIADSEGRRVWYNKRWYDYTGLTFEEAKDFGWQKPQHPGYIGPVLEKFHRQMKAGEIWEDSFPLRGKDGNYRWFLVRAIPIHDEKGNVLQWFGTNTDVTDWKEAQDSLRASERQLRLVTDNIAVFLMHCDRQHRFKFVNRPYAALFGREPDQIVGHLVSEVIGEPAYEIFRRPMDEALQGQRVEFEEEVPYAALGRRWLHVVYEPEQTSAGEVVGLVGVITDITGRKLAEREVELARDKAVAASRAKDDFLAALSHELRTPLNPALLLASEAARDPELPPEVRADFDLIAKSVSLEARLIDDLLDLTRIARGKLPLDLQPQNIHSAVQDAIATVQPEIENKHLTLERNFAAGQPVILGDAVRLQQIFWNVLKNAVKFTPAGGKIAIETRMADGKAVITIADTGIGMTAAELERAFETFTQGDHAEIGGFHRFGGLGLGLAISRMIVELHAGSIRASSPGRDQGSTFIIELPLFRLNERAGETQPQSHEAQVISFPGGEKSADRGRILLIEDHEPTCAVLASLLTRRHYEVNVAGSVAEALAQAAHGGIDLVVSDIGLPDGNGYDLMKELHERYGLIGIALTGYGMEKDIAMSREAGFVAHLIKPVRAKFLDQALAIAEAADA